jgi:hypothetical protein
LMLHSLLQLKEYKKSYYRFNNKIEMMDIKNIKRSRITIYWY